MSAISNETQSRSSTRDHGPDRVNEMRHAASFDEGLKVYLHRDPVDLRLSIDGLAVLVEQALGLDPFVPCAYVFNNRRRDRVKILGWERDGFWLLLKRLEKDRFIWLSLEAVPALIVEQLHWLLEGIDIAVVQRHAHLGYGSMALSNNGDRMPVRADVLTPPAITSIIAEDFTALVAERDTLVGALWGATAGCNLALERLRSLQHQLFAANSEARGAEQKDLFLNEAEALPPTDQTPPVEIDDGASTPVAGYQRKKRGRKPLDPALARLIVRHELSEVERVCAYDGHTLMKIGAEVSDHMDVIPRQVRLLQHHCIKYACPCCEQGRKVAPVPERIIPRGSLAEAAQAWVITGRYQFSMPLYRTAALVRRFGGDIANNTLAAGVVRIGKAAQPAINLLRDHLLDSDLIYSEETTVQVLKAPGRQPQTKTYMWAQINGPSTGSPVRLFAYAPRRGPVHAEKLYAGIRLSATLVTDGSEVYNNIARTSLLAHLGC